VSLTRQNILGAGCAAAVLAAVALAAANFTGDDSNGGTGPYAVTLVASVALVGVLFGWAIPRVERPSRTGVVVGVLGVLSIAAFWTGLPYVLGPAAIVFGLRGRTRVEGNGPSTAAVLLGGIATVGGIAALIADQLL
jgi:predicted membrane channel-forming protein YqfA (hemolysin III family)